MLSLVSPISASTSRMCSGPTPHFSRTAPSSIRFQPSPLPSGASTVTCASTSWSMSLSPVTSTTSWPSASPRRASVAITSSASIPGTSITGNPIARARISIDGTWDSRSSGIGLRVAL